MGSSDTDRAQHVGRPRRRWCQFSLRSLLVLMLLVSVGMSYLAVRMQRARRQSEVVETVRKMGGVVCYDSQEPPFTQPRAPGPTLLRYLLGEDFFGTVVRVDFNSRPPADDGLECLQELPQLKMLSLDKAGVTDAGLEHLGGLTKLEFLGLSGTQTTDAGLENLERLTGLRDLVLRETQITNAGLEHLKGLSQLELLDLRGTRVTDEGVKRIQQALPNCTIIR